MSIKKIMMAAAIGMTFACAAVQAGEIMPDFGGVPAGWTTDRYAPASFATVPSFQGHTNVLGIGINSTGNLANRPSAYQSTFYNTQGDGHALNGGAGSTLTADLYIPTSWGSANNGNVRTDMWGVMSDAANVVQDYSIFGFTNFGGAARLRVWDADNGWMDLAAPITFDDWMEFSIELTATSYVYKLNGTAVYTDSTINNSTHFSSVLMQAYNFADPALMADPSQVAYTANWSNVQAAQPAAVPEPSSIALLGIALFAFGASRRRTRDNARN